MKFYPGNPSRQFGESQCEAQISTLIADDSELYREWLKMVIEAIPGVQVLGTVGNGCQAVKLVAPQHPDLVLLDLYLPTLNGLQSVALFHEYHPAARVIIIAADEPVPTLAMGRR